MYLYHLTLQRSTSIAHAIAGNFSGGNKQQSDIVVSRGSSGLEVLRIDSNTGRIKSLVRQDLFATIRSLTSFRLTGDDRDYLIVGSDSGKLNILRLVQDEDDRTGDGRFESVQQEPYGRTGCRRTIPGQYVASDPKGRAIMTSALDRSRLVYLLNRDPNTGVPLISSPLEGYKGGGGGGGMSLVSGGGGSIIFDLVGIDVGFENPVFASLEVDYDDDADEANQPVDSAIPMTLVFYEVDLGLNTVLKKWAKPVEASSRLIAIPGGKDGPGGVLVTSVTTGEITWMHFLNPNKFTVKIPKRSKSGTEINNVHSDSEKNLDGGAQETEESTNVMISCSSVFQNKGVLFLLVQTTLGDLFKISFDWNSSTGELKGMSLQYFDSIPLATNLIILRSGFLLMTGEASDHLAYQFQSLAENEPFNPEQFCPRIEGLNNLLLADRLENYGPLCDARLMNLGGEEDMQLYAVQGSKTGSSVSIMRHGLGITEVAITELPDRPKGVWTLKPASLSNDPNGKHDQDYHSLIIISFSNSTVALSVEGESVEEANDTGLDLSVSTLGIQVMADKSIVQVHPGGFVHIYPSSSTSHSKSSISNWKCPKSTSNITQLALNERQLVLYLEDPSRLIYFELDRSGMLVELKSALLPESLSSMALAPVPSGRQRARFLAVGSIQDCAIRILGLDPDDRLAPISLQALAAPPSSLLITGGGGASGGGGEFENTFSLEIGLSNGVYVKLIVDPLTGSLSHPHTRFIAPNVPIHSLVQMEGATSSFSATMLLSSRPWLRYQSKGQAYMVPLFYKKLTGVAPFCSEQCPHGGFVAICDGSLCILSIESMDKPPFTRHSVSFNGGTRKKLGKDCATLRKMAFNPALSLFAVLSATCIGLFDPFNGNFPILLPMEQNESATCLGWVTFHSEPNTIYLAVGVASNLCLASRTCDASAILLYKYEQPTKTAKSLSLIHKTDLDRTIPSTLAAFGGMLLIGVGKSLRLFDLGRKRLLRKCEVAIPTFATCIQSQGWRVVVGDANASLIYFHYRPDDNVFLLGCDDAQMRQISTFILLDYDTAAGADRFGNFFVDRVPPTLSPDLDADLAGSSIGRQEHLFAAPSKLERQAEFYLNDTIISLTKTALSTGSKELIHYATISGAIGVFMPLHSRSDALFLQTLEMSMRQEAPGLVMGRDHLLYRSSYVPVKSVIDGDLCERWGELSGDRKVHIAQLLDKDPLEISRKLEEIKSFIGF